VNDGNRTAHHLNIGVRFPDWLQVEGDRPWGRDPRGGFSQTFIDPALNPGAWYLIVCTVSGREGMPRESAVICSFVFENAIRSEQRLRVIWAPAEAGESDAS
jgi:hypothetical protein